MRTHPSPCPTRPCALVAALLTLLTLLAPHGLGLAGCASSSAAAPSGMGRPVRVLVESYRSGQAFELDNETHPDRVDLYSHTRPSAGTKVQTDDVMDAVLERFAALGLFARAEDGRAVAGTGLLRAIEVETPEGVVHMGYGAATSQEDRHVFEQCFAAFLQVYNATYQLQSVEDHPDWSPRTGRK
jgi:hypothetical protein